MVRTPKIAPRLSTCLLWFVIWARLRHWRLIDARKCLISGRLDIWQGSAAQALIHIYLFLTLDLLTTSSTCLQPFLAHANIPSVLSSLFALANKKCGLPFEHGLQIVQDVGFLWLWEAPWPICASIISFAYYDAREHDRHKHACKIRSLHLYHVVCHPILFCWR